MIRTGRGLLLSGGAARGAFQAGVVSALARAGVGFDAIVGASVGAVNGAAFVLGYGPRLPDMWVENLRDVRWFEPARLLRGRSPFLISEAMRLMVERYGSVSRIRESPTELLISATEWHTGRNVIFSSKDDAAGWTDDERVLHFLASLTIPYVCTERIVIRGRRYCDGALSANFPLEALVARGCREIVIVDPSPGGAESVVARLFGPLALRVGAVVPLTPARLVAGFFRAVMSSPPDVAALRRLVPPPTPGEAGRPPDLGDSVRVEVVRPARDLGFASLDFRRLEAIRRALDLGLEAGEGVARRLEAPVESR